MPRFFCPSPMQKAFTLLELIIVIIIIGVLATLGFQTYSRMVEKARAGEARNNLGVILKAEEVCYLEHGNYTSNLSDLSLVDLPSSEDDCNTKDTHYFWYNLILGQEPNAFAVAIRCTAGGKLPPGPYYEVRLIVNGITRAAHFESPQGY